MLYHYNNNFKKVPFHKELYCFCWLLLSLIISIVLHAIPTIGAIYIKICVCRSKMCVLMMSLQLGLDSLCTQNKEHKTVSTYK